MVLKVFSSARKKYLVEDLGNGIQLELVAIPGGSFEMGSPPEEPERLGYDSPQHRVRIGRFFLAKYPVTQAQWQAVAALPQVNRELNPDPSHFKGANHPIERVSWYDAVEFCLRLTAHTKRQYRLPSEAEWEYACRAGTTTPFHFGETITTELANYCGVDRNCMGEIFPGNYDRGPKGINSKQTTPVGSFGVGNAFGLCDMHGNVWEWCFDYWHDSYRGAPNDGSAWLSPEDKEHRRVLRGGSWLTDPAICRSANRWRSQPATIDYSIGFRVVTQML